MSKYKITVEDTETGEQKKFDADFYSLFARVFGNDETLCATEGKPVPLEVVRIMFAMDYVKKTLTESSPLIRFLYASKEALSVQETVIDVAEMRRQASQMEEG